MTDQFRSYDLLLDEYDAEAVCLTYENLLYEVRDLERTAETRDSSALDARLNDAYAELNEVARDFIEWFIYKTPKTAAQLIIDKP